MLQTETIGTPGDPWGKTEKAQWLRGQSIQRSYLDDVVNRVMALAGRFELAQYGALSIDSERYPLFALKSPNWDSTRPCVLISGGVHGYETSGVHGAIRFMETEAERYSQRVNILVAPCVSPWAYETINRWNPAAIDPNRSFYAGSECEESAALMAYVASQNITLAMHIDLHETTDTDNSVFRPALAARDGTEPDPWDHIPDGFYLVGDSENPQPDFQACIIRAVEKVTHIAPADADGKLIGMPVQQNGVINYPVTKLHLCTGFSRARYCTTTEVYPDSPRVDPENCISAQVVTVSAALDYLLSTN